MSGNKIVFKILSSVSEKRYDSLLVDSPFRDLYALIQANTSYVPHSYELFKSYPRTRLEPDDDDPIGAYIDNGESLILQCFLS